jgi:hypothetical protein
MAIFGWGGNLFRGVKGFIGIGPAGKNEAAEISSPAVQVGDYIAFIARTHQFVILRPEADRFYTLVGTAYIGNITQEYFADGAHLSEVVELRIR